MRKIIVSEFISLDGVIEGPGLEDSFKYAGWTVPYTNDDIRQFKFDELVDSDALLLGRETYEGFAAAWPDRKDDLGFAEIINRIPKYVVSGSLKTVDWQNSQLLDGDVVDEITKLKQQDGKNLLVNGSAQLVQTLMRNNLVDDYRLLVYPVVLGTGTRLFGEDIKTSFNLVGSSSFSTGVVLLEYRADTE